MENHTDPITIYKRRGFLGRITEGFKFLESNTLAILHAGWPVLVACACVLAAVTVFLSLDWAGLFVPGGGGWLSLAVNLLVVGVSGLCWTSMTYTIFRLYVQLGYVPRWKPTVWLRAWVRELWRMFLLYLFLGFLQAVVCAIIYMCGTLSLYVGLLLTLVWFACLVPMALLPCFYMIGRRTLWLAFLSAFRKGIPAWGSTFGVLVLTSIFAGTVMAIGDLPVLITQMINYFAMMQTMEGEVAVLPGYYGILQFVLTAMAVCMTGLAGLLIDAPLLHQYGSLVADEYVEEEQETQID